MKIVLKLFVLFMLLNLAAHAQQKDAELLKLTGPYLGQKLPGITPEIFAPGIVSITATFDYACTFSPDGKEFYFTRSDRSAPNLPQIIMFSRLEKEGWTSPAPVTFSAGYSAHEPHITLDNKKILWGWFKPVPEGEPKPNFDYGIYMSERTAEGWSKAQYAGQGMFVSSSSDGKIFITDLSAANAACLATTNLINGRFTKLEKLKGEINNGKEISNIAHPCIAPDGSYLLFDNMGNGPLFASFKDASGNWGRAIDLSKHGIDANACISSISPDGKYLFFTNGLKDIYWVSAKLIENLRPKE